MTTKKPGALAYGPADHERMIRQCIADTYHEGTAAMLHGAIDTLKADRDACAAERDALAARLAAAERDSSALADACELLSNAVSRDSDGLPSVVASRRALAAYRAQVKP